MFDMKFMERGFVMKKVIDKTILAVLVASLLTGCAANTVPTAAPALTVEDTLAGISVREKVGQLFIIRPDSLDLALSQENINDSKTEGSTKLTDAMKKTLEQYPVGGVAVFKKNVVDPKQLTAFIKDLQAASQITLFTGIDEEGGRVARLANHAEFITPQYDSAAAVGETGDSKNAKEMGASIGGYISEYGLNLDFAPDADVNTNPDNTVIGDRAFSSDPAVAADMVAAAIEGFHSSGVMCCIKHFPGHGDTDTDTHYGCATTTKTWDEMLACEMLPFKAGIAAGTDMVMSAHITVPNVTSDGLPASISNEMITDKLRGEIGYDGVVITDALAMEAITDFFSSEESAVMAIQAGADILLLPENFTNAFDAVVAAVENGTITEARLDESVARILTLKAKYNLM